jgi:hypothetical protein
MLYCRKNLTAVQSRSIRLAGAVMILTVLTNLSSPRVPNVLYELFPGFAHFMMRQQASPGYVAALSLVSLVPVLLAVWVAANYLKQETDEFVRVLVVRALLWGFAVTMAGDAVLGVFMNAYSRPFPISLLNADLFVVATLVAFRVLRWSYR